jgi:acetyl-CoA C-acetyltransferase
MTTRRSSVPDRTPVLVGAAQIVQRVEDATQAREPLLLMEDALRAAAEDAGAPALLTQADGVSICQGLGKYVNPAAWLAERFGARAESVVGRISGTTVQQLVSDAACAIAAGKRDVVLIAGGEAEHSARRLRRSGLEPARTTAEGAEPDRRIGAQITPAEWKGPDLAAGLVSPAACFAVFETALRHRLGLGVAEHRERMASLWARNALVAAENPYAWIRRAPSAAEIATPSPTNPWIAAPYTKLLVANMVVDQAAALILCSAERARRLGIPEDRWVYPHAAAEAVLVRSVSERDTLAAEPPLALVAQRTCALAGLEPKDIDFLDFYSCFPAPVQLTAEALQIPLDRPLTVTGGLTYGGGPFNSYVLHAIATVVAKLRVERASHALVTGVGGFFSKHAAGVYGGMPPESGRFAFADLADEVRALPRRELDVDFAGEAEIEAYTVPAEGGRLAEAVVACRTPGGARTWARSTDPGLAERFAAEDLVGARVRIASDREIVRTFSA